MLLRAFRLVSSRQVALRARREVIGSKGALFDLGLRFGDRFAHLEGDETRVAIRPLAEELGERSHRNSALADRALAPPEVRVVRLGEGHLDLVGPERVERRDHFLGRRIDCGYLCDGGGHMDRG